MTPAHPENRSRLLAWWSLLLAVSLASRPLQSVDLWWDLARGRETLSGAVRPCQNLLTLDHASEAAWLGGVPFSAVWSVGGIFGLAAIPLLMALLLWALLRKSPSVATPLAAVVMTPLLVITTRSALEPTSWIFDLLGLLATCALLGRPPSSQSLWVLGAVFAAWSNLGPRHLWGLLAVIFWPGNVPQRGRMVLVAVVAGMLTPRGPLTWVDSTWLWAPTAFVPSFDLEARWRSLFSAGFSVELLAGGLLWTLVATSIVRNAVGQRSLAFLGGLIVPVVAVVLSRQNVAPAAIWTAALWLHSVRTAPQPTRTASRPAWLTPAVVAMTALAVADACGALDRSTPPIGWGLSQEIDPRLLAIDDLIPGDDPAIAWSPDSRSAGVAAWSSRKMKLVDHPTRAILGGRASLHAELRRDFVTAHQSRYRRDDGSWGGWAHVLRGWKAHMLFVAAEDADLHRALIETPWKLIKLDSPTVPYASGENPRFDPAVVDVMRQQSFVETGAWQPSLDMYDPQGWRVEGTVLLGMLPSPAPAIRQAAFFRAIQLPMAAVRSLAPVRPGGGDAVQEEFLRCQVALARDEWTSTGAVSRLRQLVLSGSPAATGEAAGWLEAGKHSAPASGIWQTCIELYREGRPLDAAAALTGSSGDELYARGVLWIEAAESGRAEEALRAAANDESAAVRIAADYWLRQLSPSPPGERQAAAP